MPERCLEEAGDGVSCFVDVLDDVGLSERRVGIVVGQMAFGLQRGEGFGEVLYPGRKGPQDLVSLATLLRFPVIQGPVGLALCRLASRRPGSAPRASVQVFAKQWNSA